MKKIIGLTSMILMVSLLSFGQTGPKFKNKKAWDKDQTQNTVVSSEEIEDIKGPEYKNQKKDNKQPTIMVVSNTTKDSLKGPKAKNYKSWKND